MVIEAVHVGTAVEQARGLFAEYGEFLRASLACGSFDFGKFAEETRDLPAPYSGRGGEVLLALEDGVAAGCLAWRQAESGVAEIKRLFVPPEFRGRGLARELVGESLRRIEAAGFRRCILDTDTLKMPGAYALYEAFGFREYGERKGAIAYLAKTL